MSEVCYVGSTVVGEGLLGFVAAKLMGHGSRFSVFLFVVCLI